MIRLVLLLCSAVLLAASGVTHRIWSGTWSINNQPQVFAERLTQVPTSIRDWYGSDTKVDTKQMEHAEAVGWLSRRYVQRGTGAEVSVFIICGRPGPVSVHTPDICYGGLGFQVAGSIKPHHYDGEEQTNTPPADFFWANFEKTDAVVPQHLRIYWSWKAGPGWRAPKNQRMTFGGEKALYKLYIVYRPAPGAQLKEHDPCLDFMNDFLPVVEKTLSPAS